MHPGQRFTADQAVKRLKGLVGRDSVLNALKAGQGDQRFFAPSTPVSPRNTANAIAHSHIQKLSKKCFLIVSKKQEKPQGGRPTRLYRLPTNKDLCRILAVKVTRSDALERTDLNSARQTRMALHRELLKRRPGTYPKRWLAARLGVSRRTIYTYNQLLPIHSRAMFLETPISWKTVTRLPLDEALQGAYLQTVRGKKYPALRQIASRLLARGEGLCLKQQTANYYWYGDVEPSPLVWASLTQQQAEKQEVIESFIAYQPTVDYSSLSQAVQPVLSVSKPKKPPVSKPVSSPNDYKKALDNTAHEAFATQLYNILNQFGGTEFHKLSQASARWLATSYDEKLLHATLDTLKTRAASQPIRNPVGFFITLIRSAAH